MKRKIKRIITKIVFRNNVVKRNYYLEKFSWWRDKKKYKKNSDDSSFAKNYHYDRTGRTLDLTSPKSFDEKIWWLKLNYRNPLQTIVTDKVKVREYIDKLGLGHILNEVYGVYSSVEEIDFDTLPSEMYIKCNHVSGINFLWNDSNRKYYKDFKKLFDFILKTNYYYKSGEWNYKNIEPKILCEKVIEPQNDLGLVDYRFFCNNGKVQFIFVDIDTASSTGFHSGLAKRNVYDRDFNLMPLKVSRDNFDPNLIKRPINFDKMVEYAEILSEKFPFVRMDLYNIDGKIIFGEYTFYHAGGNNTFEPSEWGEILGKKIDIENLL